VAVYVGRPKSLTALRLPRDFAGTTLKQLTSLPPLVFDIEANNLEQLDVEHVNIHVRWDRGLGRPVTSLRTLRRV